MPQSKPSMILRWAESGEIITPPDSKVQEGWVSEKPPYQTFNWELNRADQFMRHVDEFGVPEWSAEVTYSKGSLAQLNGILCESKQNNNIGHIPGTAGWWNVGAYLSRYGDTLLGDLEIKSISPTVILRDDASIGTNGQAYKFIQTASSLSLLMLQSDGTTWADVFALQNTKIITFVALPECSVAPTTSNQLVQKSYVDTQIMQYFPAGTSLPFFNTTVPAGWVLNIDNHDAMLRVVSGSGGGSGGTDSATLNDKVANHTHPASSAASGEHVHAQVNMMKNWDKGSEAMPYTVGGSDQHGDYDGNDTREGGVHTHQVTIESNDGSNWEPKYLDMIIGVKA